MHHEMSSRVVSDGNGSLVLGHRFKLRGCRKSGKPIQRTSVTHEPHVAEGVEKVALTMNAPRCVVISHVIETALRARGQCTCHERVGVIAEHLDSHGRRAEDGGTFPPVRFWLA